MAHCNCCDSHTSVHCGGSCYFDMYNQAIEKVNNLIWVFFYIHPLLNYPWNHWNSSWLKLMSKCVGFFSPLDMIWCLSSSKIRIKMNYRLFIFYMHFETFPWHSKSLTFKYLFGKRLERDWKWINVQTLVYFFAWFLNRSQFRRLDPKNSKRQASWASLSMVKPALSSAEVNNTRPDEVKKS